MGLLEHVSKTQAIRINSLSKLGVLQTVSKVAHFSRDWSRNVCFKDVGRGQIFEETDTQ